MIPLFNLLQEMSLQSHQYVSTPLFFTIVVILMVFSLFGILTQYLFVIIQKYGLSTKICGPTTIKYEIRYHI